MGNTVAYAKELGVVAAPSAARGVPSGMMRGVPLDLSGDGLIDAVAYDTAGDGRLDSLDTNLDGFADTALPTGPGVVVSGRRGGDGATFPQPSDVVSVKVRGRLANGFPVAAHGDLDLSAVDTWLGAPDDVRAGDPEHRGKGKLHTAKLLGRQGWSMLPLGGAGLKCIERGICGAGGEAGAGGGTMSVGEKAKFSCTADILRSEGFEADGYTVSGLRKLSGGWGAMELEVELVGVNGRLAA